jgi:adenylate cyclase
MTATPRRADTGRPFDVLLFPVPSAIGACIVYSYFSWVNPTDAPLGTTATDVTIFVALTTALLIASSIVASHHVRPVLAWVRRLRGGADPRTVPSDVRRRLLNAPLMSAVLTLVAWLVAGAFYFAHQRWLAGASTRDAARVFVGVALVGGPVGAVLSFLVAEFYWRRRIPLFYPDGRLDRGGAIRVPVLVRLLATFATLGVLPSFLMLFVAADLAGRSGSHGSGTLGQLVGILAYIAAATGAVSVAMALLVSRFINRPLQALRLGMAQVASGDLSAHVPVRSTDELGEVIDGFNAMVIGLRQAKRTREIFGRYVSPAVAQQALERGVALGGEITQATAMFVDLRGFTALSEQLAPDHLVQLLGRYYAVVETACEAEGGIITQFLGDGIVSVFGAPLKPLSDHARRAVQAALLLQRSLAGSDRGGADFRAGIGICTGDMVAGNVGTAGRVIYTIVGDAVNQAARLQVKTRDLDAAILITESTRRALGDGFALRACGAVALKGIAAPVEVFAVDG